MLRKINNEIKENDQKIEKNNWKDKRHDWKKYLNKNNDQTVDDHDFNTFVTRDQRLFEVKIKQEDEIDSMN